MGLDRRGVRRQAPGVAAGQVIPLDRSVVRGLPDTAGVVRIGSHRVVEDAGLRPAGACRTRRHVVTVEETIGAATVVAGLPAGVAPDVLRADPDRVLRDDPPVRASRDEQRIAQARIDGGRRACSECRTVRLVARDVRRRPRREGSEADALRRARRVDLFVDVRSQAGQRDGPAGARGAGGGIEAGRDGRVRRRRRGGAGAVDLAADRGQSGTAVCHIGVEIGRRAADAGEGVRLPRAGRTGPARPLRVDAHQLARQRLPRVELAVDLGEIVSAVEGSAGGIATAEARVRRCHRSRRYKAGADRAAAVLRRRAGHVNANEAGTSACAVWLGDDAPDVVVGLVVPALHTRARLERGEHERESGAVGTVAQEAVERALIAIAPAVVVPHRVDARRTGEDGPGIATDVRAVDRPAGGVLDGRGRRDELIGTTRARRGQRARRLDTTNRGPARRRAGSRAVRRAVG